MSLGEVQQIYYMLQEIDKILGNIEIKTENIDRKKQTLSEANRLLTTYVSLAQKTGLPPEAMQMTRQLMQLRIAIQSTIAALQALKLAYATGGPYAWAAAIGTTAVAGFMLADQMELRRGTY